MSPSSLDARDPSTRAQLMVRGRNFGLPVVNGVVVKANVTVTVGGRDCGRVLWSSDDSLACSVSGEFTVGFYDVEVTVRGVASLVHDQRVVVLLACMPGYYVSDAGWCVECGQGGYCPGGLEAPQALEGYFPLAVGQFVQCTPPDACLGGVNGTCSKLYTGPRCATCSFGAYR